VVPAQCQDCDRYEYLFFRSTQSEFRPENTKPIFSARDACCYQDSAVEKGQTYYYRAAAYRNGQLAGRSWEVSATADARASAKAQEQKQEAAPRSTSTGVPYDGLLTLGKNKVYVWLPFEYAPEKKYALIVFLHGRGAPNPAQTPNFSNLHSREFSDFRKESLARWYILAAPAYGSDSWMNLAGEEIVLEVIEGLKARLSLDSRRLYVMGVSMGGGAALIFAARHPDMIAAVCDVMGVTDFARFFNAGSYQRSIGQAFGGSPQEKPDFYRAQSGLYQTDVLKNIPILIIHGDRDNVVPSSHSETLYEKLKEQKGTVEFAKVRGLGHTNSVMVGLEGRVLDFFQARNRAGNSH